MAITKREQQILDRLDQGMPQRAVAEELGLSKSYVYSVSVSLNPSLSTDRAREQAIRQGSKSLLAALVAAGYSPNTSPELRS